MKKMFWLSVLLTWSLSLFAQKKYEGNQVRVSIWDKESEKYLSLGKRSGHFIVKIDKEKKKIAVEEGERGGAGWLIIEGIVDLGNDGYAGCFNYEANKEKEYWDCYSKMIVTEKDIEIEYHSMLFEYFRGNSKVWGK